MEFWAINCKTNISGRIRLTNYTASSEYKGWTEPKRGLHVPANVGEKREGDIDSPLPRNIIYSPPPLEKWPLEILSLLIYMYVALA